MRIVPGSPRHRLTVNKYCFLSGLSVEIEEMVRPGYLQQILVIRVCSRSQPNVGQCKLSIDRTKPQKFQNLAHTDECSGGKMTHFMNIDASPVCVLASRTTSMTISTAFQYF